MLEEDLVKWRCKLGDQADQKQSIKTEPMKNIERPKS